MVTYDGENLIDNTLTIKKSYFQKLLECLLNQNNKNVQRVSETVGIYMDTQKKNRIYFQSEEEKLVIFAMIESHSYPEDTSKDLEPDYLIEYETKKDEYVFIANHSIRNEFDFIPTVKAYPIESYKENIENSTKYVFENGYKYPYHQSRRVLKKPDNPINIEKITDRRGSLSKHWLGVTDEGKNIRIRSRSGRISVFRSPKGVYPNNLEETVFEAFIGLDFPGLCMSDEEILGIIGSIDYINISNNVKKIKDLPEKNLLNSPTDMLIEDLED